MKDDHMRNAQLKPGYNVQIAVDSEYIVAADIFQDRNDVWTLVPFLKTMERNLGFRYPSVTADSGYESEEAYTYLRSVKQKPYIKPQTYEKWKKRSFKQDISKRENMGYDEKTDTYTCHAGKTLFPVFIKKQKSKSGYESEVTVYECEDCTNCPYKEKCTKAKGNKRLYISKSFLKKRQESYEKILSETGIKYRMNRSIQVEGASFALHGHNINKLHAKIRKDSFRIFLCIEREYRKIIKLDDFATPSCIFSYSLTSSLSIDFIVFPSLLLIIKISSLKELFAKTSKPLFFNASTMFSNVL